MAGTCGYTEIQCIWSKSGYNEIQSFLKSMNLALDTIRYNVSGPSLDTMDTNLTSRVRESGRVQRFPRVEGKFSEGIFPGNKGAVRRNKSEEIYLHFEGNSGLGQTSCLGIRIG